MLINRFRHSRRFLLHALLAMGVTAMSFIAAPITHAQSLVTLLTCGGADSTSYSPGLTDTNQLETFTSSQTYACQPIGSNPQLTGGSTSASGSYTVSCVNLLQTGFPPSTATYQWNDVSQSVVEYTTSVVSYNPAGDLQIVQTGSVLSGTDEGALATETITLLNYSILQLQNTCATPPGVRSMAGPVVLNFTKLL